MMVFLAHSSLISVISYTALSILTSVATIKIYAFVMVKMGKVDHDFDPLAPVSMLSAHLFNCRLLQLNPYFIHSYPDIDLDFDAARVNSDSIYTCGYLGLQPGDQQGQEPLSP